MCGICGFTRLSSDVYAHPLSDNADAVADIPSPISDSASDEQALSTLKSMCDVMSHRGPDGEGFLVSDDIAFGHRRLSLVDLDGGAQPMSRGFEPDSVTNVAILPDNDGSSTLEPKSSTPPSPACLPSRYQIVFNGEIYNYKDLRSELESFGYSFNTTSDTEVLLLSYIRWGADCLPRLRGMFAFAVYDAEEHSLFMARDAFGIKPLYWLRDEDDNLVFASEIKSLLEHPRYERELNYDALVQYMSFQYSVLSETFFKGIYKLAPGHCMTFNLDSMMLSCERWFMPSYDVDDKLSMNATAQSIHDAVQDSVSYHKIADVEVGSFLSSGVDSNYLAASLASQQADIKTFTVGFETEDGAKYNEIDCARDAADYLGVEHISYTILPEEFWEDFPKIQWHMDEPLADPAAAALWFVDREAAKHVKAVLSGEGADELFGGYPIYQTTVENKKLAWIPRNVLALVARFFNRHKIRGANYLRRASIPIEQQFIGNAYIFTDVERESILSPEALSELEFSPCSPEQLVSGTYLAVRGNDDTAKMQYIDLNHWLVGDILLKTDKMAMAHSLESRVPFLDKEVWAVARTLPESLRVSHKTSKLALREAAEKIMPSDYTTKPKLGFPVPIRVWLAQDKYYEIVRDAIESDIGRKFFNTEEAMKLLGEHRNGTSDNSRKIWVIYTFIIWYEQYFCNE